jgi:hypothetical protein
MATRRGHSTELGFRIVAPFELIDCAGNGLVVEVYLPDLGGAEGMMIISFARRIKGPFDIRWSTQSKYSRKHVIPNLRDVGWFGSGEGRPG